MLKNIDWTVRSGEHWAILGPNGAGKSTLLLAALGLIWPDQAGGGSIVWRPEGVEEKSPLAVRAASALISPQTQAWYVQNAGDLSGEDLLLCGLYGTPRLYRAATDEDRALVRTLAEDFKLSALLEMDLAAMSQGQLRRMLIASASLVKPRILALDEAADGLDEASRKDLFALLSALAGQGLSASGIGGKSSVKPVTLLLAAHRAEDLPEFITHVLHLEDGQVRAQGPAVAQQFFLPQDAGGRGGLSFDQNHHAKGMSATRAFRAQRERPLGAPVLELENISVFLGRRAVLRDLNWRVLQGEHWAIAGPNGSGKTTLLRLIWGEIPAALGGELRRFGRSGPFNILALRREMGLVSDGVHHAVPADMLAEDVVLSGFFGSIGLYEEPEPNAYSAVAETMERMELSRLAGRAFGSLSFGEARRLLLARALVHRPALLLLDEALSGLDATARVAFLRNLSLVAQTRATQIIQVSHHARDFIPEIDLTLHLEPVV